MTFTNLGAANHPIPAPTSTASSELMMRFRSSTRCSKNVIWPAPSSGAAGSLVVFSGWLSPVIGGAGVWVPFFGFLGGSLRQRFVIALLFGVRLLRCCCFLVVGRRGGRRF